MRTLTVSDPGLVGGLLSPTPPVPSSCAALWWAGDLAALGDGGAVGGTGATWVDRVNGIAFSQSTSGNRPTLDIDGANGRPSVNFDGSNDYLTAANVVSSSSQGCVIVVAQVSTPVAYQTFWSTGDNASTSRYLFGLTSNVNGSIESQQLNADGTTDAVRGGTALAADTLTVLEWSSTGAAYGHRLNGTAQTLTAYSSGSNNGDWFGDTSSRDHFAVGALQRSNLSSYLTGRIACVIVCDVELSTTDRAAIYRWLGGHYGIG